VGLPVKAEVVLLADIRCVVCASTARIGGGVTARHTLQTSSCGRGRQKFRHNGPSHRSIFGDDDDDDGEGGQITDGRLSCSSSALLPERGVPISLDSVSRSATQPHHLLTQRA